MKDPLVIELEVLPSQAGQRLDQFLAGQGLPYTRSQIKRRITEGQVAIDGAPAKASVKVRAGVRVRLTLPPPAPSRALPEAIPLTVLYEDAHLIAIDKPAGLVVHPAAGHVGGTLVNALLHHCQDLEGIGGELRPGIVHRLDKDTTGVLVVAKNEPTLVGLQALFKTRQLERAYHAIVAPPPRARSGTVETPYGRDPRDRKKFSSRVEAGKVAKTHYRVLEVLAGGAAALVEVQLATGRTHQIRVHFADSGFPVLGDRVYGRGPRDSRLREIAATLGRQALHARTLRFVHPATGERLALEAPWPADFAAALAALRGIGSKLQDL